MPIPVDTQRFGPLLRTHRERAGLTLRELSEQTDIVLSLISQFEHARRFPTEGHVVALSTALKLSPFEGHALLYAAAMEQLSPTYRAVLLAGPVLRPDGSQTDPDDPSTEDSINSMHRTNTVV